MKKDTIKIFITKKLNLFIISLILFNNLCQKSESNKKYCFKNKSDKKSFIPKNKNIIFANVIVTLFGIIGIASIVGNYNNS